MDKVAKGHAASRVMEDDAFKDAVASVRNGIVEQMVNPSVTDDEMVEKKRLLVALGLIESRLRSFVTTGQIEERKRDRGSDR